MATKETITKHNLNQYKRRKHPQVSHHPPISVLHSQSPRYEFTQWSHVSSQFWGKSMEFSQLGNQALTLLGNGHRYTWNKVWAYGGLQTD